MEVPRGRPKRPAHKGEIGFWRQVSPYGRTQDARRPYALVRLCLSRHGRRHLSCTTGMLQISQGKQQSVDRVFSDSRTTSYRLYMSDSLTELKQVGLTWLVLHCSLGLDLLRDILLFGLFSRVDQLWLRSLAISWDFPVFTQFVLVPGCGAVCQNPLRALMSRGLALPVQFLCRLSGAGSRNKDGAWFCLSRSAAHGKPVVRSSVTSPPLLKLSIDDRGQAGVGSPLTISRPKKHAYPTESPTGI